jgi:hypothetical protein
MVDLAMIVVVRTWVRQGGCRLVDKGIIPSSTTSSTSFASSSALYKGKQTATRLISCPPALFWAPVQTKSRTRAANSALPVNRVINPAQLRAGCEPPGMAGSPSAGAWLCWGWSSSLSRRCLAASSLFSIGGMNAVRVLRARIELCIAIVASNRATWRGDIVELTKSGMSRPIGVGLGIDAPRSRTAAAEAFGIEVEGHC